MVAAAHTADLKNLDIRTIRPDTLEHIENVKINTDLPVEERMMEFVRQIKNPYIVQVEYSDTDKTINDCLKEFIESQIS